jgi:hypothetical protein
MFGLVRNIGGEKMPSIKVEFTADVKAKAERLWDILTHVKYWPRWQGTSYINPIPPDPVAEGSAFKVELGGLKWNLNVTKAERPKNICWVGTRTGMQGIHEWEFIEQGGSTRVVTRETISGWMLLPLYLIVKNKLPKTDKKWLADLKSEAENL